MSDERYWPGQRFGLPEDGPRSTPSFARRIGGLLIDWALAYVVGWLVFDLYWLSTLAVFVVLHALGGLLLAGSPGHLLCGIRIAPIAGGRLGIVAPLVRPLLIALVIPALLYDDDLRGGHDRLVGTILVRR